MTARIAAVTLALAGLGASDGGRTWHGEPNEIMCDVTGCRIWSVDGGWSTPLRYISTPIYGAPMTGRLAPDVASTETVDELRACVTALEARLADVERRVAAAEKSCWR